MHPSETCLRPVLVSLLSLSFHLADGLFGWWFLFGCLGWCVVFVWFGSPWSLTESGPSESGPSDTIVFESIAPLPFSLLGPHSLPGLSAS